MSEPLFHALAVLVQVVGIFGLVAMRLNLRSYASAWWQANFCVCFILVGIFAMAAINQGSVFSFWCCATLAVMALGALTTSRREREFAV